jgi:hypothetical protein
MACGRCNHSTGKNFFYLLLLLAGVLLVVALPDLQRYLRIREM